MKISIITLFPSAIEPLINFSILKRAQNKGLVEFEIIDLRQFGEGVHQIVDGRPYGGGAGMVLKANVLAKAVARVKSPESRVILTSASGETFKQSMARNLSQEEHLILIAGHYEGVDQRFIERYVDAEISIGDYVLTGGELPALVVADSIVRLIPGVLEKVDATLNESFEKNLLEYPQYTRPDLFEGLEVPEVLVSGNHQLIKKWQEEQSLKKTKKIRPDILKED